MQKKFIPIAAPMLIGNEKAYVMDCLDSTWISSNGEYIERFESAFADFCEVGHAISCCNGTVALHLALLALGVGPGDEVIVPSLTYIATANAVVYCGAKPVFVDSEPQTWNIDPHLIEAKITPRTKGIIAVHLYGHPADMDAILSVANRYKLFVVEDAAEAHGAEYKGRKVGSMGDIATFSFYGNKIITTGEGGMVITNDQSLSMSVRQLKGQGQALDRRYWFPIIGYNYRMTNIAAAIGLGQLEQIDWHMKRRREVASWYHTLLGDLCGLRWQPEKECAKHVHWIFTILLNKDDGISRDEVMIELDKRGIETRPVFYPMHTLPPYLESSEDNPYPVAEEVARWGFSLPTWGGMTYEDVEYVCKELTDCFGVLKLVSA
jgi:perosamine synthetase